MTKSKKREKPNCYECRWRGHVPGSAHSQCRHPYNKELLDNPMLQMMGIFASVGRVELPAMADERLHVVGNPTGIRGGWFHFPFDFDPTWLEACDGFEKAGKDDPRVTNAHRAERGYAGDAPNCEKPIQCKDCEERFECFTERGKQKEKNNDIS